MASNTTTTNQITSFVASLIPKDLWKKVLLGGTIAVGAAALVGYINRKKLVELLAPQQPHTSDILELLRKHKQDHPEVFHLKEKDDTIVNIIRFQRSSLTEEWKLEVSFFP